MKIDQCQNISLLEKLKQATESQIRRITEGEKSTLSVEELQEDLLKIEIQLDALKPIKTMDETTK